MPDLTKLDRIHLERAPGSPLHAQINERLRQLIDERFADGEQFYSEHELTEAFGVSRMTIRRALDDLDREGRVVRRAGRSTIVRLSADAGQTVRSRPPQIRQPSLSPEGFRSIGLVGRTWRSEFVAAIIDELTRVCREKGLELKLRLADIDHPQALLNQISSGPNEEALLLFAGDHGGHRIHNALRGHGYRTVSLDAASEYYDGNVVTTDARHAITLSLDHLFELGHERIALVINEDIREESVLQKIEEFLKLTAARGLHGRVVCCDRHGYDGVYARMPEIWQDGGPQRPTAIITVSDAGAWGALKWLRENGVSVPVDISVIGFEDARSSLHVTPPLTTIAHPIAEEAARAVEMLLSPDWEEANAVRESIRPTLVVRESTGPAPSV